MWVPVDYGGKYGPFYLRKSANISQIVVLDPGLERWVTGRLMRTIVLCWGIPALQRWAEMVKGMPAPEPAHFYYLHTNWHLGIYGYVLCTVTYLRLHMAYSVSLEGRIGISKKSKASFFRNDWSLTSLNINCCYTLAFFKRKEMLHTSLVSEAKYYKHYVNE